MWITRRNSAWIESLYVKPKVQQSEDRKSLISHMKSSIKRKVIIRWLVEKLIMRMSRDSRPASAHLGPSYMVPGSFCPLIFCTDRVSLYTVPAYVHKYLFYNCWQITQPVLHTYIHRNSEFVNIKHRAGYFPWLVNLASQLRKQSEERAPKNAQKQFWHF